MLDTTCLVFAGAVLLLTTIWVCVLHQGSFMFLAYAMYFPGAMAFLFTLYDGSLLNFLYEISGFDKPFASVVYSLAAPCLVVAIVEMCAFIAVTLGWAKPVEIRKSAVHEHNKGRLSGFLRAAGEEVGWRCYLLPCLLANFSTLHAFLISGIVWGLYHVPIMILLCWKLNPPRPFLSVLVQCCSCVLAAFPHGWLAVKSGYSMWPSTIMHWYWNVYNPEVLGSIYTNTPGRIRGPQWLINGEGLNGVLVMIPVAMAVYYDIQYKIL